MAMQYYYNYAQIELETGLCIGVKTCSYEDNSADMIAIPVYDEEYLFKYYINGEWYEDENGTIPWTSSLL